MIHFPGKCGVSSCFLKDGAAFVQGFGHAPRLEEDFA